MRVHSAEALILRTYRYGEADRIVVFLTEDRGKKRGVAKNATQVAPAVRRGARADDARPRDVRRARRPRTGPAGSHRAAARRRCAATGAATGDGAHRLGHAAYFAELVDEWAPENATNERLFRLGAAIGERSGARIGGSAGALFEYWLLRLEGVYPAFDGARSASGRDDGLLDAGDRRSVRGMRTSVTGCRRRPGCPDAKPPSEADRRRTRC